MKILLEISSEHYDRLLSGVSEKSLLYGILKDGVVIHPTKGGAGSRMIEILCEKFHARMLRALAENLSPQAVPQIEKAIRLSRMYHLFMLRGKTTTPYRSRDELPVSWVQNVQAVQGVQNVWNDLNYLNGWNSDE